MGWMRRLRNTLFNSNLDDEFGDETIFHLEQRIGEYVAQGLTREEARARAVRRLGNLTLAREWSHDADTMPWLSDVVRDLQYAWRTFVKAPGTTAVMIITLAIGIGATTAVFSIVEAVLLRPLPYRDANQLVAIWDGHLKDKSLAKIFVSYDDFENWKRYSQTVEQLAAESWATGDQTLTGRGPAKLVLAIPTSVDFFSLLGVPPRLGRTFEEADLTRGCTVVLSYRFWQNTLAADAHAIGQSLALNKRACTIVGVMPERFAFYPDAATMWMLITPDREQLPAPYYGVGVFGRLRPGVSLERAQQEIAALHKQAHGNDDHGAAFGPTVYPLQSEFTWLAGRNLRVTLQVLFAAVNVVLLVACVNVANLLIGRSLKRHREFAIRAALGSGRSRVVRQVLAESLLLSTVATSLGIVLASAAVKSMRAFRPIELPPGVAPVIDMQVLLFAVLLAAATAIIFGCAPAWRASQTDISATLRATGQPRGGSPAGTGLGRWLVAAEMACAVLLSVGAGLLTRSIIHLGDTSLGFEPDGLLTMTVTVPRATYPAPHQRARLLERSIEALRSVPSVEGVALSTTLLRGRSNSVLTIEGRPLPTLDTAVPDVSQDFVSPDYFRVMGIPIREGRAFSDADTDSQPGAAIINEALAKKYFPSIDPIGQRIKYGNASPDSPWVRIVGVVGNQKSMDVYHEMHWVETLIVFRPIAQSPPPAATVIVRTAATPTSIGSTIQQRVAGLDPDIPVTDIEMMRQHLSKDLSYPQFRAAVLAGLALLALLLAGVGLYAVLTQLVVQRMPEFGVRVALGAGSWDLVRLVASWGGVPSFLGLGAGVICVLAFQRVLASLLYGVTAADPVTLAGVVSVLFVIAALAMLVPARRAMRVDPLLALRAE